MGSILVVGAGFAGAVFARELAEAGHAVDVIDRRNHIAGNCYDQVRDNGVRVHRYGPHLFHTSNQMVVDWLSRFIEWLPYEHKVVARLPDGRLAPMPVNLDTINAVFDVNLETPEEVMAFLAKRVERRDPVLSAEDHLYGLIGPELTNLFFRPYTQKMWESDLAEVDAAVVRRLEIRCDRDPRYFLNDTFQAMPKDGYTRLFERILDHDRIDVRLNEEFSRDAEEQYDACFNSMPIDAYFNFDFGELPYRSIRFHHQEFNARESEPYVTINATDDGMFTRETWWHNIPGHHVRDTGIVLRTLEEPCDYKDNNYERFYPVKSSDGRNDALYARYAERAALQDHTYFIGRCGTYQYLDMHQVINQSLMRVRAWLNARGAT